MSNRRPQPHKRGKNPKHAPVEDQVMVLHDCFNTANMLRTLMLGTRPDLPPPGTPPERAIVHFSVSDRGRLERLWWAMTYVLIEAWQRRSAEARAFFAALPRTAALNGMLTDLRKAGVIEKMAACRHYMCHQGDRTYWDEGRTAPVGDLKTLLALSEAFGAVFLDMLAELKRRQAAKAGAAVSG
jgi:hypothetical protein